MPSQFALSLRSNPEAFASARMCCKVVRGVNPERTRKAFCLDRSRCSVTRTFLGRFDAVPLEITGSP